MTTTTSSPVLQAETIVEAFAETVRRSASSDAVRERGVTTMTWQDWGDDVARIRTGLVAAGVRRGDTVAIMLAHGPLTYVLDMAVATAGGTPFSIYTSSAPEQVRHQLEVSGATVTITEAAFADTVEHAVAGLERAVLIVRVDGEAGDPTSLAALRSHGMDAPVVDVAADDVATLIFTSGTTGEPKAAEITHGNIMNALRSSDGIVPLDQGCRLVSYLPAAHIADRVLAYYYGLATGATITFIDSPLHLVAGLPDARPSILLCVPRTWEKLKSAARATARDRGMSTFDEDIALAVRRYWLVQAGEPVPAEVETRWRAAEAVSFAPLREALGLDAVAFAMSGSAPIALETLEFFAALGLVICEGYGLSETTGISVINRSTAPRLGTIGHPAPDVDVRLADDGELLIRGGLVMRGYRHNPEATAESMVNGWFRSGDLATIDADGYVRIVGRKKEVIIGSSGKNISPSQVERAVQSESDLIGSIVVVGDGQPHLVALVTVEPEALSRRFPDVEPAASADAPGVVTEVRQAIERGNAKLSRPEQIRAFRVLSDTWAPGSEEMTVTMKLRRAAIVSRYAEVIDRLYAG